MEQTGQNKWHGMARYSSRELVTRRDGTGDARDHACRRRLPCPCRGIPVSARPSDAWQWDRDRRDVERCPPPYGSWWEWRGVESRCFFAFRPETRVGPACRGWLELGPRGRRRNPGLVGWIGIGIGSSHRGGPVLLLLLPRDQRVGGPWASTPLLSGCPSETFHGVFWIHRPAVLRGCRCFPLRSLLFPAAGAQVALRA